MVKGVKETLGCTSISSIQNSTTLENQLEEKEQYTLPDGNTIHISKKLMLASSDLIFHPSLASSTSLRNSQSLQDMFVASIMACDAEIRYDLASNIVITGGASNLTGVIDRISHEFKSLAPIGTAPRIIKASPTERANGSWIGGSILASIGFDDLWLTKSDYKEVGPKMITRKCP
jgi:actin-related protein